MYDNKNLAQDILKLESFSKHGDPESLAAVYFAMHEQGLISTLELQVIIEGNKNQTSAATLALGNIVANQIKMGKAPDESSINYLRWNIDESQDRPETLQSLFK